MKETKSEIYKIFKKSLDEPIFSCNKRSLSVKIDTAVKKSAVYLLHAIKEGNMAELQKEYTFCTDKPLSNMVNNTIRKLQIFNSLVVFIIILLIDCYAAKLWI